jgi:RNA polymerase sigma-70 factor (ECF subfamily)
MLLTTCSPRDADPPDAELVRLARSGDTAGLAALLALHYAAVYAVALAMLRAPADAEDAVQDAIVTALARLGRDVRDPASAGAWLRAVVRNECRMRLRSPRPVPVAQIADLPGAVRAAGAEQAAEQAATRDWVWHAIGALSPPLQAVTLLRYFTGVRSYAHIAAACGVPVGTVRSRLSQARAILARELLASRDSFPDDASGASRAARQEAEHAVAAGNSGEFASVLRDSWHPGATASWTDGRQVRGWRAVAQTMDTSVAAGVRQRLVSAVSGHDLRVWEIDVLNPPGVSGCPPRACWLLRLDQGRVRHLRLFHPLAAPA